MKNQDEKIKKKTKKFKIKIKIQINEIQLCKLTLNPNETRRQ